MAKFIGRLVDIGIKKEAARGTAETTATFWIPKMTLSLDDKIEQVTDESTTGVLEDANDASVIYKYSEGELEAIIGDKSIGLFLLALFGSVVTTGPIDSAYTHTFSVGQTAQHPSLTVFIDDENVDYRHALGMVSSFTLDVAYDKFCTYRVGLKTKVGASGANTPSYSAENKFLPQHCTVKIATTQAGLTAASAINIRRVILNVNKNLEDDRALGSTAPVDILNKQFQIDGELELVFNDETFKTQLLADTVQALRIKLTHTTLIGSTSVPDLQIDLHSVKFSEFSRNYSNNDIVTASVKFKAFYKLADAKMVTPVLINATVSY